MKKLFFAAVCMLMSLSGMAQSTVKCYVDDFSIKPGETKTLSVMLTNPDNKFVAFQFDLQLPTGVEVVYDEDDEEYLAELDAARKNDQNMSMKKSGESTYTVIAFSLGNKNLKGTEGALVNITVAASANAVNGEYTGHILNAKFSPKSGTSVTFEDVPFNVTIGEATGINGIQADGSKAPAYNVAGQRVDNPAKGIYIQNGKKVVIK